MNECMPIYIPVMVPMVVETVGPSIIGLSSWLDPATWYQRMYMVSFLPPKESGGSHSKIMVDVVEILCTFLGLEGGS